jgi:putative GTP pyrophosphokinase
VADNHLDSIREERDGYKQSLVYDKKRETIIFDASQGLNVDNLQAVLDLHFPDRERVIGDVPRLLDELLVNGVTVNGVTIEEIEDGYHKVKDILLQSEEDLVRGTPMKERRMSQTGIVRHILDLTHDAYWSSREGHLTQFDSRQVRKWRALLATR